MLFLRMNFKISTFRINSLFYLFFTVVPSNYCVFLSCRPFIVNITFPTGLVGVKISSFSCLGSWELEFKSLIIIIVGFQNFVCCLAWAVDLGVQITDVGRSLYIGLFCPAMTSFSRFSEEAAFSILISSSVFTFLWLFSQCIMDIVSSIVFISCPPPKTC